MQNLLNDLTETLATDERLVVDGKLLKNKIIEMGLALDSDLIKLLLKNAKIKKHFFTAVDGILVFDKIKFQRFVSNKEFLPDSYTSFKNKIGLVDDRGDYITNSQEVVLAWPYKDCILEGGQTKEDQKRNEIFWNETLAPDEIDRLAIVKVPEKTRSIERAFFYASSPEEFKKRSEERILKGIIDREDLKESIIEEYIVGAKFNANYFWSPITDEIDLLGFDRRIQTNLDGVLDLPADEQLEAKLPTQNVEIGHMGATMRESQIEKVLDAGEKFVETCKKEYPPGIIGLFALQGAMNKNLEFYIFDVSPRIPGCPCVEPTSPYMKYKYGMAVGPGRRVAMEIRKAVAENKLEMIVT